MSARIDHRSRGLARYPDLAGKVAVVTGASRGIGAATARALAANGVDVAVVGRDEAALSAVADSIRATEARAIPVRADCTQDDDLRDLADTVAERLGAVDILAAFAGGNGMPVPTTEETPEHWRQVIAFTRHLANELAPNGVRVNCVAPSSIETERLRSWTTEEVRRQLAESFPLKRIGQPGDVAAATLFLASDESSWITGITLDIAGGKIMI